MNKLIIIGNGFDLAHEMPTRYEDFLLWEINEAFKQRTRQIECPLFVLTSHDYICQNNKKPYYFKKNSSFVEFIKNRGYNLEIKIQYSYPFIEHLILFASKNWVDIEREYFSELVNIQTANINDESRNKMLINLNKSVDLIKSEFYIYLDIMSKDKSKLEYEISLHFRDIFSDYNIDKQYENPTMFLNFNYTDTVVKYINEFNNPSISINYIHGKLYDIKNPIIFGYGDETDENYERLEKLGKNEYLKHMKSFAYLQTSNYKRLFEFLDNENNKFDVYIMGHSLGLSDRLLFTHIFEHKNFNSVKIYYHQKTETENDFFEKTQNLSRYFRLDSKHKMRTKVVPFNESKPLIPYKLKS